MTSLRGLRPRGKFLGRQIGEWHIESERDTHQVYSFGSDFPVFGHGPMSVSLYFDVLMEKPFEHDLWDSRPHKLGAGTVCPHCGDYNPAGLAKCHRCGGETEWRPDAGIESLPLMLTKLSYTNLYDDLTVAELEFISVGEIGTNEVAALLGFDIDNGRQIDTEFFWGRTDYYLCQYCGQAVRDGDKCPSCGGTRIPWSEILQIDRECIYCGQKVRGGIVCPGCGRRLAGETISDRMGRVYA